MNARNNARAAPRSSPRSRQRASGGIYRIQVLLIRGDVLTEQEPAAALDGFISLRRDSRSSRLASTQRYERWHRPPRPTSASRRRLATCCRLSWACSGGRCSARGIVDKDLRGTHTLVSARALLTLAVHGDDAAMYEHLSAYADNSALLDILLRALSAAAEETTGRAATSRRVWPNVVRHVLALNEADQSRSHARYQDHQDEDMVLAALIPNAAYEGQYLYREAQ